MDRIEVNGSILEDGTMNIPLRNHLLDWISRKIGKEIRVIVEIRRRGRTNNQNRYYWGVCIPMVTKGINDLGHDLNNQDTHEFLKKEFNLKEVELDNGHYLEIPGSTTEMTTVDFMAYIEKIQHFAANMLGVTIPNPNEQMKFDY